MKKSLAVAITILMCVIFLAPDCLAQGDRERKRKKRRGMRSDKNALKVGEIAPNFKLKSLDGKSETELSEFKGKKPVVLIFGSYT